ncbi:MAG: RNA polymerase sigma factor [Cyclobacteriaceae bacterium]
MDTDNSVCQEKNYRDTYNQYAEKLRNFMYYRCGDLQKAEDLMHEAFTKLWQNCKKVILDKAKSYLFTTAYRLFLNLVEHEKVVLNFEKGSADNNETENPEFLMQESEFKAQLETAIGNLPEGQRTVFLLHKLDNMTFQEIADMQGTSVSAVHKKVVKALEKLRNSLNELKHRKI